MWSFKPDYPKNTPNIITSMDGLIPTIRGGWRSSYAITGTVWNGGASGSTNVPYNGSFLASKTDGTVRIFLGANATGPSGRLWEATGTSTLTDRSRAGNYTAGAFFTFCQLGDVTIAANKSDALQSSTTGAFADTAGSPPKAKFCVADANQVVLLNYNDGTDYPDGWWVSDVGTTTTWTPSSTNEAAKGNLRDSGGPITAACALPYGGVMAFKKGSCYVGTYSGRPKIREWRLISPKIGCLGAEACLPVENGVYFAGDDVYFFDGSHPVSITDGVGIRLKEDLFAYLRIAMHFDSVNSLLYVNMGGTTSANFARRWVYNTKTGEWGVGTVTEALIGTFNCTREEGRIYGNGLEASTPHWVSNTVATPTHITGLYVAGNRYPAASSTPITWTLSFQGDALKASTVQSITPLFNILTLVSSAAAPGVPSDYGKFGLAITSSKYVPGGTTTGSASATLNPSGRFDLLTSGGWHKVVYTITINPALEFGFEWLDQVPQYTSAGTI